MTALPFFSGPVVFDHVGMAVRSIRAVAGHEVPIVDDHTQGVSVAFVDMGGVRVELIEPLGDHSPIEQSLAKGQALLHLCYRVPSLAQAVRDGRAHGLHQVTRPAAAPAFGGRRITWLFSKQVGLIELLEEGAPSGGGTCG